MVIEFCKKLGKKIVWTESYYAYTIMVLTEDKEYFTKGKYARSI